MNSQRFVVKHIVWSLENATSQPKPAKELAYPNAQTKVCSKIERKLKENE